MSGPTAPLTQQHLAHAFSLRLALAMQAKGWRAIPSVLMRHFNRMHTGEPVTIYTTRSWLQGEFLPRPQRLISLAQCVGVAPHRLMYGEFYQAPTAQEGASALVLSDREHRMMLCLRRLSSQDLWRIEQLIWRSLTPAPRPEAGVLKRG